MNGTDRARALAAILLATVLTGCATNGSEAPPATIPTASPGVPSGPTIGPSPLPDFSHVYVIVMENEEGSSIIGRADAPYINSLASRYGLATNYTAIGHPSQPNYLALVSGSTSGVTDDGNHDLSGPSIFDQVEASGRTWRVAAQNNPGGCYTPATASGGEDVSGTYTRKHNPAISYTSIRGDPLRCAWITDFHGFDPAAANYTWIEPNLCNSMHGCSVATGDQWLASFLPRILASAAFQQGGVIFLTWDEGKTNVGGGGQIATLVISPLAKAGFTSAAAHDHYSLLRTIQVAWGLPCLAHSCNANTLAEFFR